MIGLLVSILIPSLKRSMDLAADTICKHNLSEVNKSLSMYRTENDGWLPSSGRSFEPSETQGWTDPWFVQLYPTYLPNPMILTCPKDPYNFRLSKMGTGTRLEDPEVADYPSYGLNSFIMTAGGGFIANIDRHLPTRPHDTVLAADLGPDRVVTNNRQKDRGPTNQIIGPLRNSSLLAWDDGFDPFIPNRNTQPWVTTRHGHGINVLTLGGGVQQARTAEVLRKPMRRYYDSCAAGGCTFCRHLRVAHYSFARDHLYWWTGPPPVE